MLGCDDTGHCVWVRSTRHGPTGGLLHPRDRQHRILKLPSRTSSSATSSGDVSPLNLHTVIKLARILGETRSQRLSRGPVRAGSRAAVHDLNQPLSYTIRFPKVMSVVSTPTVNLALQIIIPNYFPAKQAPHKPRGHSTQDFYWKKKMRLIH